MAAADIARRASANDDYYSTRSLGAGAIAGIIIGIVIVFALLSALLIWRFYTFRQNRDFFSGKTTSPYPSHHYYRHQESRDDSLAQNGHVSNPSYGASIQLGNEKATSDDQAYLVHQEEREEMRRQTSRGVRDSDPSMDGSAYRQAEAAAESHRSYPSETNRASWWWPYRKQDDESTDVRSSVVQSEVLQSTSSHQGHEQRQPEGRV